jgi:hypothetical protein
VPCRHRPSPPCLCVPRGNVPHSAQLPNPQKQLTPHLVPGRTHLTTRALGARARNPRQRLLVPPCPTPRPNVCNRDHAPLRPPNPFAARALHSSPRQLAEVASQLLAHSAQSRPQSHLLVRHHPCAALSPGASRGASVLERALPPRPPHPPFTSFLHFPYATNRQLASSPYDRADSRRWLPLASVTQLLRCALCTPHKEHKPSQPRACITGR